MHCTSQWTACRRLWYVAFIPPIPDSSNCNIAGYLSDIYHVGGIARDDFVNRRLRCLVPVATVNRDTNGSPDYSCPSSAVFSDDDIGDDRDEGIRCCFVYGGEF